MPEQEPMTAGQVFARRLLEVRKRRRWSQQKLADRLNELGYPMHRLTITKIEQGGTRARKVSLEDVLAIAAALGVAPVHLIVPFNPETQVKVTTKRVVPPTIARQWIRGYGWIGGPAEDYRIFLSELPPEEIEQVLADLGSGVAQTARQYFVQERVKSEKEES